MSRYFGCLLISTLLSFSAAQIQLLNITQAKYPSISTSCLTILNQNVSCTPAIYNVQQTNGRGLSRYYTDATLAPLCNSTCTTGLATWHRRVVGACANVRVASSSGSQMLVIQWAQEYLEAHSSTCLLNKEGLKCNSLLAKAAGVDPYNQKSTATPSPSLACHTCFMSLLSTQLAMPLAATDKGILSTYKAITSACKVTGWTVPTPTKTTWEVSGSTSTSAPTCSGNVVTLAGQTCQVLSTTRKISTRRLLLANSLQELCKGFPTSGTVCIPTKDVCTPYTVKSGDTCKKIGATVGKSQTQLISWNVELGLDCGKLVDYVGYVICVSNPGGSWVNPNPTTSTTTASFRSIPPMAMTQLTALPKPTRYGWNITKETTPIAEGSRLDCALYAQAPILVDWKTGKNSSACADVAKQYNVAQTDLVYWNPSLASDCTLKSNLQYCVQYGANDTTSIVTQYCGEYSFAEPGWDCPKFASVHGLEISQLTQWNPDLGTSCSGFKSGVSYCTKVLGYKQPGIISTCDKFTTANETNWSNKPCDIIETKFGLSHARFVAWNPAVLSNCTGIYQGYSYCVSIPGYKPTYTTPATATKT